MESNLEVSQARSANAPRILPLAAAWGAGAFATMLLFGAVLVVPAIRARSTLPADPEIVEARTTCVDHYNALVQQAKFYLIDGDRAGSVRI